MNKKERRRNPVRDRQTRARKIAKAVCDQAAKGEIWAFRALADALEGTIDGKPPKIDQDALFDEGVTVKEFLRRVKEKYSSES